MRRKIRRGHDTSSPPTSSLEPPLGLTPEEETGFKQGRASVEFEDGAPAWLYGLRVDGATIAKGNGPSRSR